MKVVIQDDVSLGEQGRGLARKLAAELNELGFEARHEPHNREITQPDDEVVLLTNDPADANSVALHGPETLLERTLRILPLDFDSLPLLVEGESKIIRLWTNKVVVMRFKPTLYSFTANRYGEAAGTDVIRANFTAELFRRMANANLNVAAGPRSAFLAEITTATNGPLIVEKKVNDCNLEVRVKRYHIGSPVHRYSYTDKYPTTQNAGSSITRWTRFDSPIVCFDWRHPLTNEKGDRLADEPLSDDYAGLWMYNVAYAKEMARQTFLWMERMFAAADVRLIDMCLFIDRDGSTIYGEISPDCMRVRLDLGDPSQADAADKDLWRTGRAPDEVRRRYEVLYERLFSQARKD